MIAGTETSGYPVVLGSGTGDSSGFGGMGGIGGLLIGALLFGGRNGFGNMGGAGGVVEGAQVGQLNGIQAQVTGLASQLSTGAISSEINELEGSLNAANIANLQGISQNALTYQAGNANVLAQQQASNYTTLTSLNGLGRDIMAQSNQNALQQLNSFNNLTTTNLQSFNEMSRDNGNGFNAIIASQNAIAAQMAACCCEIKSTITADGSATRSLINDLNVQNLQTQLADAKNQNSNLAQSIAFQTYQQDQTNVILRHLIPSTVTV